MNISIRTSSIKDEGLFQVSKWLSYQLLIDFDEMENLIKELGNYSICITGQICKDGEELVSKEKFLSVYKAYIEAVKSGKLMDESLYRPFFSSIFTTTLDDLYKIPVTDDQYIIRVSKPVLQLQAHRMHYSKLDKKFRPMIS